MSLISEKEETIRMVEQLNNIEVVRLVKKILIDQNKHTLEQALQRGLAQSDIEDVVAHNSVMQSVKGKYR